MTDNEIDVDDEPVSAQPQTQVTKPRTVRARKADVARFAAKAKRGEIPEDAVWPLANCFAACRVAQIAMGPGHSPLHAMLAAVPEQYADNFRRSLAHAR